MIFQKYLQKLFKYDPESGSLTWKVSKGTRARPGKVVNSTDGQGYLRVYVDGTAYVAHRIIWVIMYGSIDENSHIDHINGVKTDNRISNIRLVNRSGNQRNQVRNSRNSSGHVGVSMCARTGKWKPFITISGKNRWLGYFDDINDAIIARREAEAGHGFHANHGLTAEERKISNV